MALHFLSVLGTNNYEPVSYDHQPVSSYVQVALLRKFHDQMCEKDSKITIFLTKGARETNWVDRSFEKREKENMKKYWPESVCPASDLKTGLLSEIRNQLPDLADRVETVDIPDGTNENEIWEIFRKLYESIRENDQIIMDVTHSFRSIPFLMIAALNYAGVMKQSTLSGIYYGAFDAAEKDPESGVKQAPIFDLTLYNDILNWTHAADTLRRYGNPKEITSFVKEKTSKLGKQKDFGKLKEWNPIKRYTEALSNLADSLSACRGTILPNPEEKNAEQRSIFSAYAEVKNYHVGFESIPEDSKNIYPLYELLNEAEKSFEKFDVDENYKTGLAAIQWYIDNNLIQQGYTALEETAKTFVCFWYKLDENDEKIRDHVAGESMNVMCDYMKRNNLNLQSAEKEDREGIWTDIIEAELIKGNKYSQEQIDLMHRIVKTLSFSYAKIDHDIKDIRNDLNHFGMRKDPKQTTTIKERLKKDFEELKREIAKMQESAIPRE